MVVATVTVASGFGYTTMSRFRRSSLSSPAFIIFTIVIMVSQILILLAFALSLKFPNSKAYNTFMNILGLFGLVK